MLSRVLAERVCWFVVSRCEAVISILALGALALQRPGSDLIWIAALLDLSTLGRNVRRSTQVLIHRISSVVLCVWELVREAFEGQQYGVSVCS